MADSKELRKAIGEILDDADLNTITAKKVRQSLEEKLKEDLTDRKKEIDQMVMEILEERQEKSEEDEPEEEEEDSDSSPKKKGGRAAASKKRAADSDSEDDYSPAKKNGKNKNKKKKGSDSDDASDEDWGKRGGRKSGGGGGRKAAAAPKKKGGGGGTGFTKTLRLSPALSSVMGQPEMARHEVVKRIWAIIKEKNLYDPKNKQFAICNDELLPVFGVKRFRTFGMMKHLKNHFID